MVLAAGIIPVAGALLAKILVVYRRGPVDPWRSTYQSHLTSFARYSNHEVYYLNVARPATPKSLMAIDFDAVIFHYTFVAWRVDPEDFEEHLKRIEFLKDTTCPKALIPHDEHVHADYLCQVVRDYGVTHVFTPAAPSEWRKIYRETDFEALQFTRVLTGYIDDESVAKTVARAKQPHARPIDVGYRSWDTYPYFGRHGLLKGQIGTLFAEKAPLAGLTTDISSNPKDAFYGDSWFDFLLKCRYTIGVEGGTSVLDFDGEIATRTKKYMRTHPGASFEEIEAACFPGLDGQFNYFLLGPRHLEAVMTGTCQVLIEGDYGGALEPGKHYIALKRDFSNIDEVLELMKDEEERVRMVERAYADVIESGKWTFEAFAKDVLGQLLGGRPTAGLQSPMGSLRVAHNRLDEALWLPRSKVKPMLIRLLHATKNATRPIAVQVLGEDRVRETLKFLRGR